MTIDSAPVVSIAMPIATTNADSHLHRIYSLTERLIEVIERETGLLRAIRSSEAGPVQDEKARLTDAYDAESQILRALDRSAVLADARMSDLIHLSARLAEATAENEAALRFFMKLNNSVMQVIARSATASATAGVPQTYGAGLQTRYNRTRPVAVNTAS